HSRRVLHRDLKPSNVIVGEFGETVVIDWGLAKDLGASDADPVAAGGWSSGPDATRAGAVLGTPAYMAPEQARGEEADERSDVYALAALLYRLAAGSAPLAGDSASEVLERAVSARPHRVAEREPGVPPDLAAIVDKAMAPERGDRYANASQLVADLKRFQTGQLVAAHRYSRRELLSRWLRRHRTAVGVAAVLVGALAA